MLKSLLRSYLFVVLFASFSWLHTYGQVLINEYSASNLSNFQDNFGAYEDWIELYNAGPSSVSLSGYFLSDHVTNPMKWQIPAGITIPAGGFIKFWASGRDTVMGTNYHTNFKFKQTKNTPEYAVISDQVGTVLDFHTIERTMVTHSRGRKTDGDTAWAVFVTPTPGNSNSTSTAYSRYAELPMMNYSAGFHPGPISVSITTFEPNSVIRYTIDGNDVTPASPMFTVPLSVSNTTIVKARVFSNDPNVLPSNYDFRTFFINENHSLPVVSISGSQLVNLANGNQSLRPYGTLEYFDETGLMVSNGTGEFNSHGQDSWVHPQRSLDWITRDEMGINHSIKHKIFPLTDRDKFQRLILRAEGDDNYPGIDSSAHMRDMYTQTMSTLASMNLDVRKAAKCVVYLNGNYWGVYSLREKVDDPDYTQYYYDQDKYDIEMIMIWGSTWIEYGYANTYSNWLQTYNFINTQDLTVPANWEHVDTTFDWKSLADYTLINSYVVCSDWLNWNTAWWRGNHPAGSHHKWGYLLWDEDATFGHYINYTGIPSQLPNVDPCFPENLNNSFSDPEGHMTLLNKLRANQDFDQWYISRYVDLLNTWFSCDSMLMVLDSIVAVADGEMNRHCLRWGGSYNQWQNNVQKLRDFITTRCNFVSQGINGCYGLTGPYDVVFNVDPPNSGHVRVNSLTLQQFPWSGGYHSGLPILMEAIEYDTTWIFDRWEVINHSVSPNDSLLNVSMNINGPDSVIAHFAIRHPVSTTDPLVQSQGISVYPNPFSEETTILVEGNTEEKTLIVRDILGKPVMEMTTHSNSTFKVNRKGLSDGVYFYRIEDKKGNVIGNGKLIID